MKILFSVYSENRETEDCHLIFSEVVETEMTISKIDEYLEIYDLFRSVLEVGQNLAFWDIYCFGDFEQVVINKIKAIPITNTKMVALKEPTVLKIQEFDPGNADSPFYPNINECYFYKVSRFECGASSFDAIIAYIQKDPILAGVIGSMLFEFCKMLVAKLYKFVNTKKGQDKILPTSQKFYFSAKKFYRNFQQITNVDRTNCQIVRIKKIKNGKFTIIVRTLNGEAFDIKATYSGKIENLNTINISNLEW